MRRNLVLKASLLVVMVLLCVGVPIVNAEDVVVLNWTSPTTKHLYAVHMVSPSDGWAAGRDGTIIRWNGVSWSNWTSPTTATLWGMFMLGADDGWAAGKFGTIIRWNGSLWSTVTSPVELWGLESVYMLGDSDGWIVGYGGTIIRWTGAEWIPEFPAAILTPLLMSLTLVVVILAKTLLKKRRKPSLPSKTQL